MSSSNFGIDIIGEINSINERLENIEESISFKYFSFPLESEPPKVASNDQLRFIQYTLYDVYICKPYPNNNEDPPLMLKTTLTRDELDDYLSKNPGRNFGEFVYKIIPVMDQYL